MKTISRKGLENCIGGRKFVLVPRDQELTFIGSVIRGDTIPGGRREEFYLDSELPQSASISDLYDMTKRKYVQITDGSVIGIQDKESYHYKHFKVSLS